MPRPILAARSAIRKMAGRAVLFVVVLAGPAAAQPLPDAVLQALLQAQVPAEALGAVVLPAGPGLAGRSSARWAHQADRPMQPASTLKLLTSAVALDQIGPNVRGFTELLTPALQQGDVLAGDLVLRGGANPEFDLPQLWAMLLDLRQVHGIREIAGDIVIDRTLFRPSRPERDATPFDERPEFAYNLVPDALQLNSHLLQIEISSEGGPLRARALPPLPGLQLDTSALTLNDRPCHDWVKDWASPPPADAPEPGLLRVRLQGSFPKACTQRPSLSLIDPLALAERQLRWLWASLGGSWSGRVREAEVPTVPLLTAAQQAAQQPPVRPGAAVVAPGVQRGGSEPGAARPGAVPGLRLLASHQS
nr:D-alanyl-D-alanine carboxypeptidase [Aquabacterium sp.]